MTETSRPVIKHRGEKVPTFLYGTAWKEDRTGALTHSALSCGFLGIDTANQRLHYDEAAVGKAVQQALAEGDLKRSDLFLQGFSLLTANAPFLNRPEIQQMSQQRGCSAVQIVFRFALQAGMIPLTGTTSEGHMKEDLAAYDIELSQVDVEAIENIALS
jgi:diketogulonate reductase-like aldo/keto reductase